MSDDLLNKLKDTSADDLIAGVAKQEGVNGSILVPQYSKRTFKCYSVTESELQQIGLANLATTFTSSVGFGLFAFWLDVFKDTTMAEEIPPNAALILDYVRPITLIGAIVFWIGAIGFWLWRRGMISTIKKEANDI